MIIVEVRPICDCQQKSFHKNNNLIISGSSSNTCTPPKSVKKNEAQTATG